MGNLKPILQAAKEILQDVGLKGMHVKELAEIAVKHNTNMGHCAEEFQKKLQGALAANLKLKNKMPTFAQVNHTSGQRKGKPKQGWYRLRISRSTPPNPKPIEQPQTGFLGKAGEYAGMG